MAMHLFEHNQTAYKAAVAMLSERGKAAVIHPTGTGKSFIGFKLCEDNPDKTICWLSPSKYIYETQLENLAQTSDGYQPENIRFFTYAKLMLLSDDEIAEIQPDFKRTVKRILLCDRRNSPVFCRGQGVQGRRSAR